MKTQISYAANLLGNVEEEHAGGAIAFPSYSLGDEFHDDAQILNKRFNFSGNDFYVFCLHGGKTQRVMPLIKIIQTLFMCPATQNLI